MSLKPLINEKNIEVKCKFGKSSRTNSLKCDWGCVNQILFNLLSNAIRFSNKDSSVNIECNLSQQYSNPSNCMIEVKI